MVEGALESIWGWRLGHNKAIATLPRPSRGGVSPAGPAHSHSPPRPRGLTLPPGAQGPPATNASYNSCRFFF